MLTTSLLLALALGADPSPASATADPFIAECETASINDQAIPGVDAGVLTILTVKEGARVTKGMEIGRIDDSEAQAQLDVKQLEYDVAKQAADSTIEIQTAQALADVAKVFLQKLQESNKQVRGTVTAIDILKAQLEWKRAVLAIKQAEEKRVAAELTAKAKAAEVGASKVALERRVLRAPFDGVVVRVSKKPGEWVAPGEAVLQIVGINKLRVMGELETSDWAPADVDGRTVTVEVLMPHGRNLKVPGKVIFASPVAVVGKFWVTAEIETPMSNGLPVVRAGLTASMTIHVSQAPDKTAPVAASKPSGAPAAKTSPAPAASTAPKTAPTTPVRQTTTKSAGTK